MITNAQQAYFELASAYHDANLEEDFWRCLGHGDSNLIGVLPTGTRGLLLSDGDEQSVVRFLWWLRGLLFDGWECTDDAHQVVKVHPNGRDAFDACSYCGALLYRIDDEETDPSMPLPFPTPPGG